MVEYGRAPIRVTLDWLSKPFFAFLLDPEFRLIKASPSFHDVLGYSHERVIGKNICQFLDPASPLNAGIHEMPPTDRLSEVFHDQSFVFVTQTGSLKVVSIQATSLQDEQFAGNVVCALAQDITKRYCVENELRNRLSRLEMSLNELTQREKDVLDCVVKGKLNKSIAKQMEITVRAVERIRSRLRKKFCAQTSAEMVSKATEHTVLKAVVDSNESTSASSV